jgi:hypothetical protein
MNTKSNLHAEYQHHLKRSGRLLAAGIILLACTLPLYARNGETAPPTPLLEQYREAALSNSPLLAGYELQKQASELQTALSLLEQPQKSGISVTSGSLTASTEVSSSGERSVTLQPAVSTAFEALDLIITVSAPASIAVSDAELSAAPKVTVEKRFGTADTEEQTGLQLLQTAAARLQADLSYRSGLLNLEKTVLQQLRELIQLDASIAGTAASLSDAEQKLEQDLKLGNLTEGTAAWQRRVNTITRLEHSLSQLSASRERAAELLQSQTGLAYTAPAPEDIPAAALSLESSRLTNTELLIAALAVEQAREKREIEAEEQAPDLLSGSTFSYLASGSWTSQLNQPSGTYSHTLQAGISASSSALTFEAGVAASLSGGTVTPTGYLTGRWNEPEAAWTEYDDLQLQILENQIESALVSHDLAQQEYLQSLEQLAAEIARWLIEQAELDLLEAEYTDQLELVRSAFERGIGTDTALKQAERDLELLAYDRMLLNIDSQLLETDIRKAQL